MTRYYRRVEGVASVRLGTDSVFHGPAKEACVLSQPGEYISSVAADVKDGLHS